MNCLVLTLKRSVLKLTKKLKFSKKQGQKFFHKSVWPIFIWSNEIMVKTKKLTKFGLNTHRISQKQNEIHLKSEWKQQKMSEFNWFGLRSFFFRSFFLFSIFPTDFLVSKLNLGQRCFWKHSWPLFIVPDCFSVKNLLVEFVSFTKKKISICF